MVPWKCVYWEGLYYEVDSFCTSRVNSILVELAKDTELRLRAVPPISRVTKRFESGYALIDRRLGFTGCSSLQMG